MEILTAVILLILTLALLFVIVSLCHHRTYGYVSRLAFSVYYPLAALSAFVSSAFAQYQLGQEIWITIVTFSFIVGIPIGYLLLAISLNLQMRKNCKAEYKAVIARQNK
jgi:hypothetical protein